jgi:hypothetical protein
LEIGCRDPRSQNRDLGHPSVAYRIRRRVEKAVAAENEAGVDGTATIKIGQ